MTEHIQNSISKKKFLSVYIPKHIDITEGFKTKDDVEKKKGISDIINNKLGDEHPFEYTVIEGLMKKFGLVNSVVDKIYDFTIGPGFDIECDDEEASELLNNVLEKSDLHSNLEPWFKEGLSKGSGYIEVAKNGSDIVTKFVNSNNMYVEKDDRGNVLRFNQFTGNSIASNLSESDITRLDPSEIIQININSIGGSSYGYGIVYSALQFIDDFLMAQSSIHKLTKRKANVPIHAKLGNAEKDDYPQQADIDGFGNKLTFMNEVTEWVTGPNVEMKVIDFGNIGDKFDTILANDYKLLSYSFQVPEVIMGSNESSAMGQGGKSSVQMDGFSRRMVSYQNMISNILKKQFFDIILKDSGYADIKYNIVWKQLSEEKTNSKIEKYQQILSLGSLNSGLRREIEKKLAILLDIDEEEVIKSEEEEVKKQDDKANSDMSRQVQVMKQKPAPFAKKESIGLGKYVTKRDIYDIDEIHEASPQESIKVSEWINADYSTIKNSTIQSIESDTFEHLLAENKWQVKRGYLTEKQVEVLKEVLIEAVEKNLTIGEIKTNVKIMVDPKDFKSSKSNKITSKEKRVDMIAKSELTRVLNDGIVKNLEALGRPPTFIRWDAIIDEATCPICQGLSNSVFTLSTLPPRDRPPIHPNCRCSLDTVPTKDESFLDIIQTSVDSGKAPQEIESILLKNSNISSEKAIKLVESFTRLSNDNTGEKRLAHSHELK